MTPGGKVGHRAFAAVGYMADDAKHMKRRPVALGQAISGFRLLSTGSGSRGKKKGRLPDGSGPQRDRTRPRPYAVRGAPSGLLLQVSPRSSRALWSNTWRREGDLNPREVLTSCGFQDRRNQPLCHPSADQFRGVTKMVEPVGIEPTLSPCKGGVLPLNYGPVKIMVGAAGIEPATACSQSRRAASALRSDAVTLPCITLPRHATPSPAQPSRA